MDANRGICRAKKALYIRDRRGTPKNLRDKNFAELSGELSGVICLKPLVLLGSALELFRRFFRAVRAIFGLWGSSLALFYIALIVRCLLRAMMTPNNSPAIL